MNKVLLRIFAAIFLLGILMVEAQPDGRIVGGADTSSIYTKYVVQLRRRSSSTSAYAQTCGGCILDEVTIATAAHCVYNRLAENFLVVAGDDSLGGMKGVVVRVTKLIPHELYNASITDHDIALVIVDPPLPLTSSSTMEAIEIASEQPAVGVQATVSGWGYTQQNGLSSNQLQQVKVPVVDSAKCQESYYWRPISDGMLCAGLPEGGKDACQGDSGGPLVVDNKLAGIVSWGQGCAQPNYPGVYANVAYFGDWIAKQRASGRPSDKPCSCRRSGKGPQFSILCGCANMSSSWLFCLAGFLICLLALTQGLPLQETEEQDEKSLPGGRIVGGTVTDIAQVPYQISLRYKGITTPENPYRHRCGGAIIAANRILTAAHCVIGTVASQFKVIAGSNYQTGSNGVITNVKDIIMHEDYFSEFAYNNDVAILVVDPPLPLNNFTIQAINMSSEEPLEGAISKISGWGTTSPGGSSSNLLLSVEVPIVSNEVCGKDYENFGDETYGITPSMLCAGKRGVGGADACQGDSGGPLAVRGELHGIVSWGNSCALATHPGVYAKVAYLKPWIDARLSELEARQAELYSIGTSRPCKSMERTMCIPLLLLAIGFSSVLSISAQPEGRIINGTTVDIARHPYLVSLRYRRDEESSYKHECAGVIISEQVLVTSAQCIDGLPEGTKILAVAGANTRNGTDGFIYPVSNWTHHPNYDPLTVDNDVGVLFLDTPLNLTHFGIRSIGIRPERPAVGRLATVAGWGYREEWGPSSYNLEQTEVPVVSSEECTQIYGAGEVTERMICAGFVAQGGSDACQGDTGGPLVIDNQLVGLVSWGRGCARPNYPTVYCYVASLVDWIEETIAAAGSQ
ncbi:transmembrane protease serine 9-like [Drosophila rhopaloa]|uniref:trypsin n=1 Tax=Drosophila rhopaloa TaxID=1041015 RepID=A0A6P4F297_DRORH|nr:transmembrane protease serine 9-like [Drosophila rhopaloa]